MNVDDIQNLINLDTLKNQILQTSISAWNQHITRTSLDRWLRNFNGDALGSVIAEQTIAAWLLMNFTYYTKDEVRELCRVIYRKYIHNKLEQEYYRSSKDPTSTKIRRILQRTIFIPLGNPSESGALILYNFRTANALPKTLFEQPKDWNQKLSDDSIDDIVLIDDVTLSGSQAIEYINSLTIGSVQPTLLTFFATPDAIDNLQHKAPNIVGMYAHYLDARAKLFDDSSFVFSNDDCAGIKELAYTLCIHYGKMIVENELPPTESYMKSYPLGFADGQQMFGFWYNTPDNSLPIFWCDSPNWKPAFTRYNKIYNIEGVDIQDDKYW